MHHLNHQDGIEKQNLNLAAKHQQIAHLSTQPVK